MAERPTKMVDYTMKLARFNQQANDFARRARSYFPVEVAYMQTEMAKLNIAMAMVPVNGIAMLQGKIRPQGPIQILAMAQVIRTFNNLETHLNDCELKLQAAGL